MGRLIWLWNFQYTLQMLGSAELGEKSEMEGKHSRERAKKQKADMKWYMAGNKWEIKEEEKSGRNKNSILLPVVALYDTRVMSGYFQLILKRFFFCLCHGSIQTNKYWTNRKEVCFLICFSYILICIYSLKRITW